MKICVVTGGRADWGLLEPVCEALQNDDAFDLHICATGQHILENAGDSLAAITNAGFLLSAKINFTLQDDTTHSIIKALGEITAGFADTISSLKPDLILVLGDRYEILGAVQAALIAKVPVAHLCGGDITEGAIDDSIRHAITKISHIHFTTNNDASQRIIQMGENPDNVFTIGSTGLDQLRKVAPVEHALFFESIKFTPHQYNFLVTFHPVTLEENSQEQCTEMLSALKSLGPDFGFIFTGSNADVEGQKITQLLKDFVHSHSAQACFHQSLGTARYINALRHVDGVIGNSSSGLYEAPSFNIPTINIGNRQKGRLKAPSVIDCPAEQEVITKTIKSTLKENYENTINPYGDGYSAHKVVEILKKFTEPDRLIHKRFFKK